MNESINHSINHRDYLHNIQLTKVYLVPIFLFQNNSVESLEKGIVL